MDITLQFIASYLNTRGIECRAFQFERRALRDVRMYRGLGAPTSPEHLYLCRTSKIEGDINTSANYMFIGDDIPQLARINRILVSSATNMAELQEIVSDLLVSVVQWERGLSELIIQGGNIQSLLELSSGMFDNNPLCVVNTSLMVLGYVQGDGPGKSKNRIETIGDQRFIVANDIAPKTLRELLGQKTQHEPVHFDKSDEITSPIRVIRSLISSDDGYSLAQMTIAQHEFALCDYHLDLAEHLSSCIRAVLLRDSRSLQERTSMGSAFLVQALTGSPSAMIRLEHNLKIMGWYPNDAYCVLAFTSPSIDRADEKTIRYFELIASQILSRPAIVHLPDHSVIVCATHKKPAVTEGMTRTLANFTASNDIMCGISNEFSGFETLTSHYNQACFALSCAKSSLGSIAFFKDYVADYFVQEFIERHDVRNNLHPAVLKLAANDEQHESHLAETLYAYLSTNRSYNACAELLHVHKSTVHTRLNRIRKICGDEVFALESQFDILISLKIHLRLVEIEENN